MMQADPALTQALKKILNDVVAQGAVSDKGKIEGNSPEKSNLGPKTVNDRVEDGVNAFLKGVPGAFNSLADSALNLKDLVLPPITSKAFDQVVEAGYNAAKQSIIQDEVGGFFGRAASIFTGGIFKHQDKSALNKIADAAKAGVKASAEKATEVAPEVIAEVSKPEAASHIVYSAVSLVPEALNTALTVAQPIKDGVEAIIA